MADATPIPAEVRTVVLTSMEMADAQREMLKRARDQCVPETKKYVECTKNTYLPNWYCKDEFKAYEACLAKYCGDESYRKVCDDMRVEKLRKGPPTVKKS